MKDVRSFVAKLVERQRAIAEQPKTFTIAKTLADRPIIHIKPRPTFGNRPRPPQHGGASNM
ncbi:hypothetical protein [Mesorhizobium australicum]|uniref:hypothetical protein n=1 Tax=Mesorhizobium australicum TaxID=536018 RepID=UPI0033389EFB